MTITPQLLQFIAAAKIATYAGEGKQTTPSRTGSIDLPFQQGEYTYLDSYLGGYAFIGEEVVWHHKQPVWGMNYYGTMLVPTIPEGFGHFLKQALLHVPELTPFRGPALFQQQEFTYTCAWSGDAAQFEGREMIYLHREQIYTLNFHGGVLS